MKLLLLTILLSPLTVLGEPLTVDQVINHEKPQTLVGSQLKPERLPITGSRQFSKRIRYKGKLVFILIEVNNPPTDRRLRCGSLKLDKCGHPRYIVTRSRSEVTGKIVKIELPTVCSKCGRFTIGRLVVDNKPEEKEVEDETL